MKLDTHFYNYQNGTQLLTLQDKSFNSMVISFVIKIGSKHETPEINGISHFLEHMLFKGTEKYPNHQDINKTWLSDRDRFGYEGIYSADRALKAMIRVNGKLVEYEKQVFLQELSKTITKNIEDYGSDMIGCLLSGQSTNE